MFEHERKYLYVLRTRRDLAEPYRELSAEERLAGWTPSLDRQWVFREGHGSGLGHDLTCSHVLSWLPRPGDEILAAFPVDFLFNAAISEVSDEDRASGEEPCVYRTTSRIARYSPEAVPFVVISASTVLGRAVLFGEDDADGAFGRDAIYEQVAHGLLGDWRDSPCEYTPKLCEEFVGLVTISRDDALQVCTDIRLDPCNPSSPIES